MGQPTINYNQVTNDIVQMVQQSSCHTKGGIGFYLVVIIAIMDNNVLIEQYAVVVNGGYMGRKLNEI